jgi:PAS domain S-box-containing protein
MSPQAGQGANPPPMQKALLDPLPWALQENHQDWYRDLVEHSHDLLCIHDLQGRLLAVNRLPARLLGYSVEEILRIPMREIVAPEFREQFDAYLKHVERAGEAHGVMVVVGRSGERRIWEYHNTLRSTGVAEPVVRGIAHDVTEQRRADAMFRGLLEAAPDALVVVDAEARIVLVNAQVERMFGYRRAELLGQRIEMLVPERLRERHRDLRNDFLLAPQEKPMGREGEFLGLHKDGREFPIEINLSPMKTAEGLLVTSAIRDITERKQAEDRLRQYEKALEGLEEMIVVVDRGYRYVIANRAYLKYRGMENEQLIGRHAAEVLGKEIFETVVKEKLDQAFRGNIVRYQMKYNYPEVGERDLSISYFPIEERGQIDRVASVLQDITERRQAEQALRESGARERARAQELATMLDVLPIPLMIAHDADCRHITANRMGCERLRLQPGANASLSAPAGERPRLRYLRDGVEISVNELPMQRAAATGRPVYEMPTTMAFEDGTERHELSYAAPLLDQDGKVRGAVGAAIDITERKRAEEELRASEERLRLAQEVAKIGMFERNLQTGESRWSPEMEEMYGLPPGGFPRTIDAFLDLVHGEDRPYVERLVEQSMRTGDANGEWRVIWPDGAVHWIAGRWQVFQDEHGRPVRALGMDFDITQRKQAEEALRTSEERLRVALKNAPITVFHQDRELRYTWAHNLSAAWAESDILGKTDAQIFEPEAAAQMMALKRVVLESGEGKRQMLTLSGHGEISHFDVTVEPLRDREGKIVGVNSACMDVTHLERITEELRHAQEKLAEEKLYLEQEIDIELGFEEIVGKSIALKEVMEKIGKVAASDATVLLLGETGTGKELVARALHRLSRRAGNSFIKMNCAAIPTGLLESELFGYEKGAFTGAISKKLGRLELADKGTLFLDEIGEIPLALQPKLLRVLQDQEFERLGGTQTIKVDFRLIAATNRDLAKSVNNREFRSDLYYRLNVFPVQVPPLRDRPEDIPLLVEHFVQKCAKRMNKKITSIPKKTMAALTRWDWPGNVRELENFVERSVILTLGSVLVAPLSELAPASDDAGETLEAAERELILRALRESHGQVGGPKGAAARLGLKRTTLQSKLKQMGFDRRPRAGGH